MKLTYKCPICDKQLKLSAESTIGNTRLYSYTCGHTFAHSVESVQLAELDFNAVDGSGKVAREYQKTGVQKIIESDFNQINADQMRLGKTPTALLALKNRYAERTPCLIIVKGANLWQWIREYKVWVDPLPNGIFPIIGGDTFIVPGFKSYIISMDTFSLPAKCKCKHSFHEEQCKAKACSCKVFQPNGQSIRERLETMGFRLVIVDEAHSFKNTDSNRSEALVTFMNHVNIGEEDRTLTFTCSRCANVWTEEGKEKFDKRIGHTVLSKSSRCPSCGQYCYVQQQHKEGEKYVKDPAIVQKIGQLRLLAADESTTLHERNLARVKADELKDKHGVVEEKPKACGIVLLTGTPILNRADEYFVPLNLVSPERFSSLERFRRQWLQQDHKGRYSRVKEHYLTAFKNEIAPFMFRREKEDVFTDLPALNKFYTLIEPDKTNLANQYNKILDKLEVKLAMKANPTYWDMADDLMELRRICGMMKLMWTADYLETCAMDTSAKYAIGIHHESVRDVLYMKLGGEANCFKLSGQDNSDRKDWIMRNWEHSNKQFLIINMLAGGVGMDFHYCDNVLVLERQWNSEMEGQFEFRFYNPDKGINKNTTNVEYILARGTLDEWWYDMVEAKRRNVGETVYNNWDLQKDTSSFKELVERTVGSRL